MQELNENNEFSSAAPGTADDSEVTSFSEQQNRHKEAEARVDEIFANARAQRKPVRKKRSLPSCEDDFHAPLPSKNDPSYNKEESSNYTGTQETAAPDKYLSSDEYLMSSEFINQKLSYDEAQKKVDAIFASARSQRKPRKTSGDSILSREILPYSKTDEKQYGSAADGIFAGAGQLKKAKDSSLSDGTKDSSNEAMEKAAEIFAIAGAQEKSSKKNGLSSLVKELVILEFISLIIFIFSLANDLPGGLSLFAVFMPVIAGIGYRMFFRQLSLQEAVSKCRPHIVLSCLFFLCALLSV